MSDYRLTSEYKPRGDQPRAIAELTEGIERGDRHQVLLGVTGSGKTFTMANVIARTGRFHVPTGMAAYGGLIGGTVAAIVVLLLLQWRVQSEQSQTPQDAQPKGVTVALAHAALRAASFSAHLTNYAANGLPTEQHAAYYAARARYFAKFYGRRGLWLANGLWYVGRAVSLDPGSFRARLRYAQLMMTRSSRTRGCVEAKAALALFPLSPDARQLAAGCKSTP